MGGFHNSIAAFEPEGNAGRQGDGCVAICPCFFTVNVDLDGAFTAVREHGCDHAGGGTGAVGHAGERPILGQVGFPHSIRHAGGDGKLPALPGFQGERDAFLPVHFQDKPEGVVFIFRGSAVCYGFAYGERGVRQAAGMRVLTKLAAAPLCVIVP